MKHHSPTTPQLPEVLAGTAGMSTAERREYSAHVQQTVAVLAPINPAARRMAERVALCHWRIAQFEQLEKSDFAMAQPGLDRWARTWRRYWKRNLTVAEKAFRALQTAKRGKKPGRTARTPRAIALSS